MTEEKKLLKVQYGDVYVQITVDDKKAFEFVIKFLSYFVEKLEKKKAISKVENEQK